CDPRRPDLAREAPGQWLPIRFACARHAMQSILPSGESVAAFLGRRRAASYPLEGSGLNLVVNPVTVDGRRGWNDFAGGGRGVLEEVFPARDYFEFFAQHSWKALPALYVVFQ